MIEITLFPKDITSADTASMISKVDQISEWLMALPPTKRGNLAYRMTCRMGKIPSIIFVRRDDAIAFRLKFGL